MGSGDGNLALPTTLLSVCILHVWWRYDKRVVLWTLRDAPLLCLPSSPTKEEISHTSSAVLTTELFYASHRLIEDFPNRAVSWYAVGAYYFCLQKYENARKHFTSVPPWHAPNSLPLLTLLTEPVRTIEEPLACMESVEKSRNRPDA